MLPHWRKMTWAVVLWTAFFVAIEVWLLSTWDITGGDACHGSGSCADSHNTGMAAAVVLLGILGIGGLVVLLIGWAATIRRGHKCPKCGAEVAKDANFCPSCDFSLTGASPTA